MNYDEVHLNLCQNIRHLRKVHLLTQREMAQIIGISVGMLRKIECGCPTARISCAALYQVCKHFHVSSDAILFENWPQILEERYK